MAGSPKAPCHLFYCPLIDFGSGRINYDSCLARRIPLVSRCFGQIPKWSKGKLVIPANHGEVITPHANFRVVATSNDLYLENAGLHPDAQAQDVAYVNRYNNIYRAAYCTEEQEREILVKQGLDKKRAAAWVSFATLTREAHSRGEIECPISTRNLVSLAQDPETHTCLAKSLCSSVLNRYSSAEALKILELAQRAIDDQTLTQPVVN